MTTPAGWYPDPSDPTRSRWWDGTQWAEGAPAAPQAAASAQAPASASAQAPASAQAAPSYTAAAYPAAPPPPGYAATPSAPGADTNTIWIYLAILVTTLPVLSIFFLDMDGWLETFGRLDQGAPVDDRAVAAATMQWIGSAFAITAVTYLLVGLSIVFAWLDWRELKRRGVARPFHWAWAFFALLISIGVYVIGRTVVLKRETGSGLTALWVWIGSMVLAFLIGIVWTWVFFQEMAGFLSTVSS
jgi:hypothetical protein